MAKIPTIATFPPDPASDAQLPGGAKHLGDYSLARGGVMGLGFVPHALAGRDDEAYQDAHAGVLDAEYVTFVTDAAADVTVPHRLRRIPRRFTLVYSPPNVNVQVFRGTTEWTDSRVYFRGSVGAAKVTVEIA